tara:strand:+ start:49 stop:369 length:321 start_codon:yes stop_codon:yes gene_type:complete
MNIINWFITPKEHILKGDVVLSAEEVFERVGGGRNNRKELKNMLELSSAVYEYKDLGKIAKCVSKDRVYSIVTKRGEKFVLNLDYMDRYFIDNHLKGTTDYLKTLC